MDKDVSVKVEYIPEIKKDEVEGKAVYQYSLSDLSSYGGGIAIAASSIVDAIQGAPTTEGMYRCVFPSGITGNLAAFKDGSGLTGTIMNENGIVGQARWVPVEGDSAIMSIDPVSLAVAIAVISISKKLDKIQQAQEETLRFLHHDKESKVEADIITLEDILNNFQFQMYNSDWVSGQNAVVTEIKRNAISNIMFYQKQIKVAFEKKPLLHVYQDADKIKASSEHNLKYYQLSAYSFAFSSFLEMVLSANYSIEYADRVVYEIDKYSKQYTKDYRDCYHKLESRMKGTVEAQLLGGLGDVSKTLGKALSTVPIINEVPIGDVLVDAGDVIKGNGSYHGKKAMRDFENNRDAGIQMFIENVKKMSEINNNPVELLFDSDNVYLCV